QNVADQRSASQRNAPGATVPKALSGGMSNYYDDSWGILNQGLQSGQNIDDILGNVLKGFKGKPGDLEDFMGQIGPFMGAAAAGQIRRSKGFQYQDDPANW